MIGAVVVEPAGEVSVVAIAGEHDIATAPGLRDAVGEAFAMGGPVLVDLTGATFVDSTVLGVLLAAREQAQGLGVGFGALLGDAADASVRRIVDVTGVAPLLPVHVEREAALAAVRA